MIDSFENEYYFLSNFYEPAIVSYDGVEYPTTEHAFQAAKTLNKGVRQVIQEASNPGKAKRLGQKVTLRNDWEDIKIEVMRDLVCQKFQNPELRQLLLDTGDQELIEGNTWNDQFWGMSRGWGLNHLGKILMQIREEIQVADLTYKQGKHSSGTPR